jgi:hypothetical protein
LLRWVNQRARPWDFILLRSTPIAIGRRDNARVISIESMHCLTPPHLATAMLACSRHQPRRLVIATVTATATVTTAIRLALAEGVQAVNRTRPATRVAGRGFFWARHRCVCHAPLKGRTVLGTRSGKEQSVHLRNEANDPKACRFQDLPGAGIFEMGKCPDFPKL